MPCILIPYLKRDPAALSYVEGRIGLGALHKYAHKCRMKYDMVYNDLTGATYEEETEHWFGLIKHLRERLRALQYNAYITSLETVQDFRVEQLNAQILRILKEHIKHSKKKKKKN